MKYIIYIGVFCWLAISVQIASGQNNRSNKNDGYKTSLKQNDRKQSGQQSSKSSLNNAFLSQFDGDDGVVKKNQNSKSNTQMGRGTKTGESNLSKIDQIGSDKYSKPLKNGSRESKVIINQSPYGISSNKAVQKSGYGQGGFLFIEQFGNNNTAVQDVGGKSEVVSQQHGDDNLSKVGIADGENNKTYIYQEDDKNKAIVGQKSNNNQADINQLKGNNLAKIMQNGSENIVQIDQSKGSKTNIHQYGTKNTVRGNGSSWAESLNGSILDVEQRGSFNELDIKQNNSRASLQQSGIRNKTVIIQK